MAYKSINLSAGVEMRVDIAGALILVDSVSTWQGVDIAIVRNGTASAYIPGRLAGFRMVEKFDGVLLKSALACTVGVFLSTQDVQLGGTAGGDVAIPAGVSVTNDLAHSIPVTLTSSSNTTPIPVSLENIRVNNAVGDPVPVIFTGAIDPVLGVTTVDNTDAEAIPVVQKIGSTFSTRPYQAVAVANVAPVAVTAAAGALVAADAARRGLRIRNAGAAAVALGGAGVAFADAAVLIQPGETWNENEAPGAAWYCICDAALASTINIQTIA